MLYHATFTGTTSRKGLPDHRNCYSHFDKHPWYIQQHLASIGSDPADRYWVVATKKQSRKISLQRWQTASTIEKVKQAR